MPSGRVPKTHSRLSTPSAAKFPVDGPATTPRPRAAGVAERNRPLARLHGDMRDRPRLQNPVRTPRSSSRSKRLAPCRRGGDRAARSAPQGRAAARVPFDLATRHRQATFSRRGRLPRLRAWGLTHRRSRTIPPRPPRHFPTPPQSTGSICPLRPRSRRPVPSKKPLPARSSPARQSEKYPLPPTASGRLPSVRTRAGTVAINALGCRASSRSAARATRRLWRSGESRRRFGRRCRRPPFAPASAKRCAVLGDRQSARPWPSASPSAGWGEIWVRRRSRR